ncbi:MAG: hypothetical protein ABEJ75_04415 [Candidatus Nanohaloarchaea archaeon]
MKHRHIERFLEFLFVGVLLGITEDLIAVKLSTNASITPEVIGIVFAVAIPFAVFSELIVDREDFIVLEKISHKLKP